MPIGASRSRNASSETLVEKQSAAVTYKIHGSCDGTNWRILVPEKTTTDTSAVVSDVVSPAVEAHCIRTTLLKAASPHVQDEWVGIA